jgi:hypothetical protein
MKGLFPAFIAVVFVVGVAALMYMGYNNSEVSLRNQGAAQQKVSEAVFDNTWKIIAQQANVAEEYRDSFEKIYPELMQGRYENMKNLLGAFVTESNPNFDTRLFEKLMVSIEAQRTVFTNEQKKLIDIKREHDNVRTLLPGSLFVGSRPPLEIKLVTSERTDRAFQTGRDNDTKLFDKK